MAETVRFGSFNVDHEKLQRGIYVSRVDKVLLSNVYTIDFRMKTPYKEEQLTEVEMHSLEHILASRVEETIRKGPHHFKTGLTKLYVGPMGCATGFYFVLATPTKFGQDAKSVAADVLDLLYTVTEDSVEEVPFNSMTECGCCYTLACTPEQVAEVNEELFEMHKLVENCLNNGVQFDQYPYIEE